MIKYDIVLAGVGGQGVLSLAAIIATAAMQEGLNVRQSEVHGMAQRGGAVQAHLRISDGVIFSDLVPLGSAEMILAMEPLESLRYTDYLHPEKGVLVTAAEPLININNYPQEEQLLKEIGKRPRNKIISGTELAKQAGSPRAANIVMVGAASNYLPLKQETLKNAVKELFQRKGDAVVDINLKAFSLGREA